MLDPVTRARFESAFRQSGSRSGSIGRRLPAPFIPAPRPLSRIELRLSQATEPEARHDLVDLRGPPAPRARHRADHHDGRGLALLRIPVAQFPDIVPPQVSVSGTYPGASAEVVEASVAQPLEAQIIGVDRIIYMKSASANDGSYSLSVSFALGSDPDIT